MVVNMNRQFNRRHINKRNEVLQTPPTNMQMALEDPNVRMSPLMELTIVGGLGVFIMIAPNIASFMKEKVVFIIHDTTKCSCYVTVFYDLMNLVVCYSSNT